MTFTFFVSAHLLARVPRNFNFFLGNLLYIGLRTCNLRTSFLFVLIYPTKLCHIILVCIIVTAYTLYAPCHLFVTRVYTTFVYNVIASSCVITPCMTSSLRIASSLCVRPRCFVLRHHSVYDAVASYCVITPCMTSLTSYCVIAASSFVSSPFA